jgi:hypothetical protein
MSSWQVRFLLGFLFLCGATQATEIGVAEIGWVLEYAPISAEHRILRAQKAMELRLGTPLLTGDVIDVVDGGDVLVGFADGSERRFSGKGRWELPIVQQRSAIWSAMQSLLGMVERQGKLASSASTRDPGACITSPAAPLRVPLFERPQRVIAGTQTLSIAWEGGCPTFSMSVKRGETTLASRSGLKDRLIVLKDVQLIPGTYSLAIGDGRSNVIEATFNVVPNGPAPQGGNATSPTMRALLDSVWLSDHEQGVWRAESLKRLQPLIAERQPIASRIADLLLLQTSDGVQ